MNQAARDVADLYDLIASLPDRLFDGDLQRYCGVIGLDDRSYRVMSRGATGTPARHCRPDMIYDGSSYRLIELNSGSELGGSDTWELNRGRAGGRRVPGVRRGAPAVLRQHG